MYMFVPDLPILSRAGTAEINNMMRPHGSGRMEEKHKHVWCACVWQHSHAQHRNELSRIRLSLIEQGLPWGKHVFMKMWRAWDKWVLVEKLLMVQSLKWLDKIRWKKENWLSPLKCSPLEWDCNTIPLLKINFQAIKRKMAWVELSKRLRPVLKKQKEICWINGEGTWGGGVRLMEIMDRIFHISEIWFRFPCVIRVIIASPMNKVFKFFIF